MDQRATRIKLHSYSACFAGYLKALQTIEDAFRPLKNSIFLYFELSITIIRPNSAEPALAHLYQKAEQMATDLLFCPIFEDPASFF